MLKGLFSRLFKKTSVGFDEKEFKEFKKRKELAGRLADDLVKTFLEQFMNKEAIAKELEKVLDNRMAGIEINLDATPVGRYIFSGRIKIFISSKLLF